jgi:hypothetical protein
MNGTVSRRIFVGSLAGAGVGALGATSLDLSLSAQRVSASPLLAEIRGQLKDAFGKMQNGQAIGARQAATILRVYASTLNDDQLRVALSKANRQQLLLTDMNHGDLVRQAKELGIDPSRLPRHSLDRVGREEALDQLLKEGLSPFTRTVADYVDRVAEKMERMERRSGGAMALQVALRQPIPEPVNCGNCDREKQELDITQNMATVVCAAAAIIPLLVEACAVASATYLTFYLAFTICNAILALCRAYYN